MIDCCWWVGCKTEQCSMLIIADAHVSITSVSSCLTCSKPETSTIRSQLTSCTEVRFRKQVASATTGAVGQNSVKDSHESSLSVWSADLLRPLALSSWPQCLAVNVCSTLNWHTPEISCQSQVSVQVIACRVWHAMTYLKTVAIADEESISKSSQLSVR